MRRRRRGDALDDLRTPGDIYVASPNDNVIIEGVAGFPTLSSASSASPTPSRTLDRVKILRVDGGDGCVVPDTDDRRRRHLPDLAARCSSTPA